jgi:NitT/TauT family transport system ATP-binding protein
MSPRPGRIAEVVEISLPRPRDFFQEGTPAFHEASQRIRALIYAKKGDAHVTL